MAAKQTPLPVGEHETTCVSVFTGTSKRGMPQLTLVMQDATERSAKRYCPLSKKDITRTLADLAVLGWTGGDLSDLTVLTEFLQKRPIIGQKAMVRIEPYGDEGKSGVALMWRVGDAGPWISEAQALHAAMQRASAEDDQGGDDTEVQEQPA